MVAGGKGRDAEVGSLMGKGRSEPDSGARVRPRAVVVTVGDELLVGDRVDTNARDAARILTDAAFQVVEILSVGDAEAEIVRGIEEARGLVGAGVVVVTGGLGPTTDDRTREAVALHLEVPLEEDPDALSLLEARYRERGRGTIPALSRRMARVPRGARVLPNPVGVAPGLEVAMPAPPGGPTAWLYLLPGVPAEMRGLLEGAVLPALDAHFPRRIPPPLVSVIRTSGIPESGLAEALEAILPSELAVNLQYRPSVEGVELRMSASGPGAELRLGRALEAVEPVVAPWRYGGAGASLAMAVLDACTAAGWSVATAESCTGGMVGAALTAIPGSSRVFLGGVVAYHNEVKTGLLGVEPVLLQTHGAVSAPVARAMAEGIRRRTGATLTLAVTGVAGPGGGSEERPVGTVWFALDREGESRTECVRFPGDREEIRRRSTQHGLRMIWSEARRVHLESEG